MYSLCLDCGATNVRAMVVDKQGAIVGKASQPNATLPGEENPEFHVWDADRIFRQLSECAVKALEGLNAEQVTAVTITTFGVDGTLVDDAGNLLYPVISWKCPRTAEVMKNIGKYISQEELNRISGVGAFAFNTIYKLVWLRENHPELLEKAHAWLFISNLLAYKLTGIMATDRTMAGTSQLTDLETGDFSEFILNCLGLSRGLFPPIVDAGETIGLLTPEAADAMNLPALAGIPVISAGHDTQFAIFGSGADKNQPVLSSGTWEILMARSAQARLAREDYEDGATAVQALMNGQADCVVIDNAPAQEYVKANPGLKILDTEFANEDYAIGVAKGNTELLNAINGALEELQADGTLQSIVDKYIKAE